MTVSETTNPESEALAPPADPSRIRALMSQLANDDSMVRENARQALVEIGAPAVPNLTTAAHSRDHKVRLQATKGLAQIGDARAAAVLVSALQDKEFDVRWLAAEGLLAIGLPGIVPLLRELQHSGEPQWLRQGAVHVLRELQRRDTLPEELQPVLAALTGVEPSIEAPLAAKDALERLPQLD